MVDAHDHLFFASAMLPGEELGDVQAAEAELAGFAQAGGGTVVQWTPHGLDGRPDALCAISTATGVHVVAATGRHQRAAYGSAWDGPSGDALAQLFLDELQGAGVRAGVIKVAGGYHSLGDWERESLDAAAAGARAIGAPICVHLEAGTHGPEVLSHLDALGVPADQVILGHLNRYPDLRLHRELAQAGAFIAYDGPSRNAHATDWRLLDLLEGLASDGLAAQVLLGADTTTRRATTTRGEGPGMRGLIEGTGARIARELGTTAHRMFFIDNPARALRLR
jgi:phosphotriesterase-related protein